MRTISASLQQLGRILLGRDVSNCADAELVRRFAERRDEAAFAALVRRYGPLVLGVCRRVLRHEQDAEDAFQATFVVLARNAGSLRRAGGVGQWLYGVAWNVARKANAMRHRRRLKEREAAVRQQQETPPDMPDDLREILDATLHTLPDKYRTPIVLCDLLGMTVREAAVEVGCPEKTLGTRLRRGRSLLADRLTRRGVAISVAALTVALSQCATAEPPPEFLNSAVRHANDPATVPPAVAVLTKGVLNVTLLHLPRYAAILTCGILIVAGLSAGLAGRGDSATSDAAVQAVGNAPARGKQANPGDFFEHLHMLLAHLHAHVHPADNRSDTADEKKDGKESAAPSGVWVRKVGELKLDFPEKDVLKLYPHGDDEVIVVVCSFSAEKGKVKAKITALEGKEEAKEKAKALIPVGMTFEFKWAVKGDAATLDDVKGDEIDLLKAHLEGDYERKK
jgi:RNA polymerase sigma factor (sigma-70 family)